MTHCSWFVRHHARRLFAAALAVACVTTIPKSVDAQVKRASTSAPAIVAGWDTFSADMTVHHGRVNATGETIARVSAPDTTFHIVRTRSGATWKTSFSVIARGPIGSASVQERPDAVRVRIEDAGDGSPIRMFDGNGIERHVPTADELAQIARTIGMPADRLVNLAPKDRPSVSSAKRVTPDPVESFAPRRTDRVTRQRAFERQHGAANGQVHGLTRYLSQRDGTVTETLVDPGTSLPAERNFVSNGALVSHATYDYSPLGSDRVVRTHSHVERLVPGTTDREVTDVSVTNVKFEKRGGAR